MFYNIVPRFQASSETVNNQLCSDVSNKSCQNPVHEERKSVEAFKRLTPTGSGSRILEENGNGNQQN